MTLLDIDNVTLDLPDGRRLLNGVSLTVGEGETVGLVGESGSGKSLTARAVIGLLPTGARTGGNIRLDTTDVLSASPREIIALRRSVASMIFQDPRASINPVRTIGDHLTEALRLCLGWSRSASRARAIELLEAVRLPRPAEHVTQYPHELSGGMLQRVMIAGALTTSPRLLICDEPTTALDVTTQAETVKVLVEQSRTRDMSMLFITHDLNLAASLCDRIYVMRNGEIVEQGTAQQVLSAPTSDYTRQLVAATPTIAVEAEKAPAKARVRAAAAVTSTAVEIRGLTKTYRRAGHVAVPAVADVDLDLPLGGALGVVGESGSGKSTLGRMIVGLERPDSGSILIGGSDRTEPPRSREARMAHARSVQMVFQDPYLSLDPRIPVGRAIEDALRLHATLTGTDARSRVLQLLDQVGLAERHAEARPRTLSGGQRQRVAIARALAIEPELLVMDEATSSLDVSVQAQVLDLVADLRKVRGLTVLFISHDLAVVRRLCESTVVMRSGRIVEQGPTDELLRAPQDAYTRLLIASVPRPPWVLSS